MKASSLVWTSASSGTSTRGRTGRSDAAPRPTAACLRASPRTCRGRASRLDRWLGRDPNDAGTRRWCRSCRSRLRAPSGRCAGDRARGRRLPRSSSSACTASVWLRHAPTGSSSTDGPVGNRISTAPSRNAGSHSTRWRTTSRATQPSTGAGRSHDSGAVPSTVVVNAAATRRCSSAGPLIRAPRRVRRAWRSPARSRSPCHSRATGRGPRSCPPATARADGCGRRRAPRNEASRARRRRATRRM